MSRLKLAIRLTAPRARRAVLILLTAATIGAAGLYLAKPAKPDAQVVRVGNADTKKASICGKCSPQESDKSNKPAQKALKDRAEKGSVPEANHSAELFAPQSWYVPPPPPAPVAMDFVPVPTAPPLPYSYVGSYAPVGEKPTYFLARGDRVIDAHTGDKLDGTLLFEKVEGGQLVFLYLPLNIQQTLPVGVVQ